MARVALITFSDGRDFVYRDLERFTSGVETEIGTWLEARGHEVVHAAETVTSSEIAVREARRIADARPDLTIVNIPVWAFPHFTMLAARETPGPLLLFSNARPAVPGHGRDAGRARARSTRSGAATAGPGATSTTQMCGAALDVHDPRWRRGQRRLRGSTFGRIGGRPMGMYTAVANTDQWIEQFGIDVEEIDQWELVRRAEADRLGARVSMRAGGSSSTLPAFTTTARG